MAMGLLVKYRGQNGAGKAGMIGAQVVLGIGAGSVYLVDLCPEPWLTFACSLFSYPTQVLVQAAAKHEHVAVLTALYLSKPLPLPRRDPANADLQPRSRSARPSAVPSPAPSGPTPFPRHWPTTSTALTRPWQRPSTPLPSPSCRSTLSARPSETASSRRTTIPSGCSASPASASACRCCWPP